MFIVLIIAMVGGLLPDEDVPCFWDAGFSVFRRANEYFHEHRGGINAFMIVCGLLIDVLMVT